MASVRTNGTILVFFCVIHRGIRDVVNLTLSYCYQIQGVHWGGTSHDLY